MLEQNFYLKRLLELKNNFSVKIISGVRGVGKTTLLKAFAKNLRSEGVAEDEIIFLDCAADERFKNFQTLYEFVEARTLEAERFFLLIDEVDGVEESEKAINALFVGTLGADKNILPKLLRGMTYEIMFDFIGKNSLRQAGLFHTLMKILAQNVCGTISLIELIDRLNCKAVTLKSYLNCSAGLFQRIPRFDIKEAEFIKSGEKIYCIDNGLLCALAEVDEKFLPENAVYVELLRRGFSVSNGKFGVMNINFVAKRGDEKIFIQVLPPDNSISVRKITRPLRALPADAEKILITPNPEKNFGGIKNVTLHDFLLNV